MSQMNSAEHPLGNTQGRQSLALHEPRPTYQTHSRPSLSKLTDGIEKKVAEAAASQRGSPLADGPSNRAMKGKGGGVEMVEVIVHPVSLGPGCTILVLGCSRPLDCCWVQVKAIDSIMAVALKYGVGVSTLKIPPERQPC
jgi:hypothetical protein